MRIVASFTVPERRAPVICAITGIAANRSTAIRTAACRVTNAKLTIRNEATGITQTTDTGSTGLYIFRGLTPTGKIDEMKMAAVSPLADFSFDYQDLLFRPVTEAAQ